jgi:hypothetical protein
MGISAALLMRGKAAEHTQRLANLLAGTDGHPHQVAIAARLK